MAPPLSTMVSATGFGPEDVGSSPTEAAFAHQTDDHGVPLCLCLTCREANRRWNEDYIRIATGWGPMPLVETYEEDWTQP